MAIGQTETKRTMTGWQAVVEALRAEGVPYVFGLPGDPGHLYDAVYELEQDGGPRAVGVRYETSGAFLAMAYTRVTGKLAACFGCPGPGIANLVPGVLEAFSGCTPMLVLGVRASRQTNGMGAFQETDHIGMMKPITKWATTVEVAERIPWTIRRAIQLAYTGQPGPVYVELPADVGLGTFEIGPYTKAITGARPGANADDLLRAADLIAAAKRPLLITGGGCYLSGAGNAVAELSERFGIPVQTTPAGRSSVAETHPLFCGVVGLYRTTFPKQVYEASDLIITVGSRMEEFQGGFLDPGQPKQVIQIEIDDFEIGRNWVPDVTIQSDARLAVEALDGILQDRNLPRFDGWAMEVSEGRNLAIAGARADSEAAMASNEMPMTGKSIVSEINRVFGHDTVLVKENGGQDLWVYYWPYYQVLDQNCCVAPAEQTAMGYGIIGAMAAKLAEPNKKVVSTSGDGAFQMSIHELGTAVQNKLGITWVVMNDNSFGWVQWIQRRGHDNRIVATSFEPGIDIVATAKAAGCDGIRVERPDQLGAALEAAIAANEKGIPFVVEVPVDQSHHHAEFDRYHGFEPLASSATV
ncbi:MAG: thiamine pyrophosphate-binding protein [Thermomicrobiales bacterium]|nr:thiamine pyrophosphate-binding protein [Thermomicrobiales bacterium]